MTVTSRWIDIPAKGGNFQGYLALPKKGKGPAVIIIQEIFGVNSHIQSVADQYAADGYVALAPDIFWRTQPRVELGYEGADREKAIELMGKTDAALAVADVGASAAVLRALAEGLVDIGVAYYGGGIQNQLDLADKIKAPMQFHFGELDAHIPISVADDLRKKFAGREAQVFTYAGADHGFNCSDRASYNQPAAALAHGRALTFLGEHR
jgi:carboxymethylenebutenolidase